MNFDLVLDSTLLDGFPDDFQELLNPEGLAYLPQLDSQPAAPQVPPIKLEDEIYNVQNYPENLQNNQHLPIQHHIPLVQPQPPEAEQNEQQNFSQIYTYEFPGPYEFEVYINPHHGKKSPWMYSSALNKVFIAINLPIRIDFKCKFPDDDIKLFIRATPIYSQSQYSMDLVTRCINHANAAEPTNKGCAPNVWDHVVRCHHRNAFYGGSKPSGKHLYVRVPLCKPPSGMDSSQLQYQFMCKNSCGSGMNRRPIDVVFTLENEKEEIIGRRVLSVRICSCPKRDKDKDEADYYKKDGDEPRGKKRKLEKKTPSSQEISDNKIYKLELNIPGAANVKAACKQIYGMLAAEMMLSNTDQQAFKKCMLEIKQKMNGPFE